MSKAHVAQLSRLRSIEGRHNAVLKQLRKAFGSPEPASDGVFAIEGLRIIEEAIRSGLRFRTVFFAHSAEAKAQRLLPQLGAQVETVIVPDRLLATAVPTEAPQGVAALVQGKVFGLDDVLAKSHAGPVIVIFGLQDPGNLGTILRSAEAFGAAGVLLAEGTVSPFNSKVVRASAGSVFRVAVVRVQISDFLAQLRERQIRSIATSSHKGTPLPQASLTPPLAMFIGGEGTGLGRDLIGKMDELIAIPHSSKVESLNAGVAASIILYEAARQRQMSNVEC
ncbi:MAG: RNA methyltransferase [Acidobacteriaceae bacterium]|nr:RNA methyltransferase [Acidobacteriaceae bacterium]